MKKCISIAFVTVWVFLLTSNMSGQSVKTEQEVRLENFMNTGKYISIAPSNLLNDNVRLVLPHLLPAGRSVMYVSEVSDKCAILTWQPADSIGGINKLLSCDNYFLGTSDSISMSFYTDSLLRITITADGRVGIGTDSPSGALEVKSNRPTIISAPTGEIPDDSLENGQVAFYTIDSTGAVYIKAKKSNGAVVTQSGTAQIIRSVVSYNLPQIGNVVAANKAYMVVNVVGAEPGDGVVVSPSATMATSILIAYAFVSASNTVTVCFKNGDSASPPTAQADNPLMNFIITVIK